MRGPLTGPPGRRLRPRPTPRLAVALDALLSLADGERSGWLHSGHGNPGWVPAEAELDRLEGLVKEAQAGNREAYAELYDQYVGLVYRYLHYRTRSHVLAEDLTSETFLRALRRLDSFVWQGHGMGPWFLAIARNLVLDHFRSASYRHEVATADMLDADRPDAGIEDAVLSGIEATELLAAVRTLKPDQQECIVLRFLQGLSQAETATVMGRSEGAIKQLQLRAVKNLARALPEDWRPAGARR